MLHLDLESDNHRGDETHTDTEEVVGEVTLVQRQFMVQHRLRHRRDRVKTQTRNIPQPPPALCLWICVCVSVWLCMQMCALVPWEKESVAAQFLVVIFNQNCGGWIGKCVCLVLCLALGAQIISFCLFLQLSLWDTKAVRERERGNKLYLKIKCTRKAKLLPPWCWGWTHCAVFNSVLHEAECVSVRTCRAVRQRRGKEKVC